MGIVKINIQCNKLEITSVAQKKLLLLVCVVWNRPCICRRGTAVVWSRELCVYSFRVVLELCVIDEEGCVCLSVCFLVSCVCVWFSLEFGSVTARTSTTANFCLPNTQHVHALKHTHTLPQVCLNLSWSFSPTSGKSGSPNRPAIHLSEMCIKGTSHFPEKPPVISLCPQTVVEIHATLVTSGVIFSSGTPAPL